MSRFVAGLVRLAAIMAAAGVSASATTAPQSQLARPGVCMREWAKFVRVTPLLQTPKVMPKLMKVHDVAPRYPTLPAGTTASFTPWSGEFLIDPDGHVAHVWPLREVRLTPAFPAFNQAIVEAIQKWRYEPLIADGKPISMCGSVSVNINWQ